MGTTGKRRVSTQKGISGKAAKKMVEFSLNAPNAHEVYLVGEFNKWNPHSLPMKHDNGKEWKAHVQLAPGRYEYKYYVDGSWIDDVPGVEKAPNSFGSQNCVMHVK